MRNIIAIVDFSSTSDNAARYAADVAAAIQAELHLVHVLDYPAICSGVAIPDYVRDEIRNAGFNALKDLAEELLQRTRHKITIVTDLETGSVELCVQNFCQWKHPFLVVRGAPATRKPAVNSLPYPLLSVPSNAKFDSIRHILLTGDGHDIDRRTTIPTQFLQELRELFHAEVGIWQTEEKPTTGKAARAWLVVCRKTGGLLRPQQNLSSAIVLDCPNPVIKNTSKSGRHE